MLVGGVPYSGRKGFIDKETDKESGNGDFGARKYSDDLGRFLSCDALWEKYRGLSPYHYAANSPLKLLDRGGLHVVVAFSGANIVSEDQTASAGEIVDAVTNQAAANGVEDFDAQAFATNLWDIGETINEALAFITENYSEGEQLVVYGYSKGGEAALHLARMLEAQGIQIDLLETVDAANGLNSDEMDRTVSANVKVNNNHWQPTPDASRSRGAPNTPINPGVTTVNNTLYPLQEHTTIDEASQNRIIQTIIETLQIQ